MTLRFLLRALFRFRVGDTGPLATPGPVLLVPNHVSWLDWLFLAVVLDDDWRFVTSKTTAERNPIFRSVMINRRTFPIDPSSPWSLKSMADYLSTGGRLVLFAEGRISITGNLMKIFEGGGWLLHRARPQVIVACLRGAERTLLASHEGRRFPFPSVRLDFDGPHRPPATSSLNAVAARRTMTHWLRDLMLRQRLGVETTHGPESLYEAFLEAGVIAGHATILEDGLGRRMSHRSLRAAVDVLETRWLRPSIGAEERVGVMLPNGALASAALLALWRLGRVPAIFNYTMGPGPLAACVRLSGVTSLLTSRAFIERTRIDPAIITSNGVRILFVEEAMERVGLLTRFVAWLRTFLPAPKAIPCCRDAVILFTSGSESAPKGVRLTHAGLLANIRQVLAVTDIVDSDRVFNALPIFHSFGLTVGLLLPLVRGIPSFQYLSPVHYGIIPEIVYDTSCTIMLATGTFLDGYARRAHPYDFRSLRLLFAGAEKLRDTTAHTWAARYGVRVLEGYGATECGPCIAVNTPLDPRQGSVGRFLPGIEWRLEPQAGIEEGGRLLVRGPNIMSGYLNPDANRAFQTAGGWYDTGDIAVVDTEGFLHLKGRVKRFAKIGGEMISLAAVEDAVCALSPRFGPRFRAAIISVGVGAEALVLVVNDPRFTPADAIGAVRSAGLPNLAVPRRIEIIRDLPLLGSGKADYRAIEAEVAKRLETKLDSIESVI